MPNPFDPATRPWWWQRSDLVAENAALVTVLATETVLATLDLGQVEEGDRIWTVGQAAIAKGATAGATALRVKKDSGGASLVAFRTLTELEQGHGSQPLSTTIVVNVAGLWRVTVAGTLLLRVAALSAGSNGSVAAGAAGLRAWLLREQGD